MESGRKAQLREREERGMTHPKLAGLGVIAVAAIAAVAAGQARADSAVLPTSNSLPWTDPAHHSPLEVLPVPLRLA
jgi:hypothetical protein